MAPTNLQIVLQQVRWYWISGTLLVWQFTDNGDDVIGLRYTESRQVAVRWRCYEVRRWTVGGGSANAGDLVVETTMQIVGVSLASTAVDRGTRPRPMSVSMDCHKRRGDDRSDSTLAFALLTQKVAIGSTLCIPGSSSCHGRLYSGYEVS